MIQNEPKQVLKKYGSSFYWASQFLGKTLSQQVARLYKFCRYVDNLADSNDPNRELLLNNIKDHLVNKDKKNQPEVVKEFLDLVSESAIPVQAAEELMEGMLSDQGSVRIANERELLRYCHAVAGTVGVMVQSILNCSQRQSIYFAVDLGVAMQLTNIARDILEDAQIGRRYIPSTWLDIEPEKIAQKDPSDKEAISRATKKLLSLAETYYESASEGIYYIPVRSRIAIAIALKLYRQIGVKLIQNGPQWWKGRTIVSNKRKILLSIISLNCIFPKKVSLHKKKLHKDFQGLSGANEF